MTGRVLFDKRIKKWQIILSYKKDGKTIRKQISTNLSEKGNKKRAEAMISDLKEKYAYLENEKSENANSGKILFTQAITNWLESKRSKIELSTFEGYKNYITAHILPYFTPLKLYFDEVTPKHIRDYYEDKFKNGRKDGKTGGLAVRSIKKHGVVLKQIFNEAGIAEQIIRNPANGVPLPKNEKSEFRGQFLTAEEAQQILKLCEGHFLQPIVYTALYYALRRSEILGLRWSAINFTDNTIKINHTVVKNLTIERKDRTKSKTSNTKFPLLPEVKEVLQCVKSQQDENRRFYGNAYINSDYVFTHDNGSFYHPDHITKSFKKILVRNGLKVIRFHDIRHSTASILYDMDWAVKDIQEWLRHADVQTTLDIYTHITENRIQKNAKNLTGLLKL